MLETPAQVQEAVDGEDECAERQWGGDVANHGPRREQDGVWEGSDHKEHRGPHQPRSPRDHPAVAGARPRPDQVDPNRDDAEEQVDTCGHRAGQEVSEARVSAECVHLRRQVRPHAQAEQGEQHRRKRAPEDQESDLFDATFQVATACWNRDRLGHGRSLGQRNSERRSRSPVVIKSPRILVAGSPSGACPILRYQYLARRPFRCSSRAPHSHQSGPSKHLGSKIQPERR